MIIKENGNPNKCGVGGNARSNPQRYFGELIKPCKFLSDLYFDSLNSLNEQIK